MLRTLLGRRKPRGLRLMRASEGSGRPDGVEVEQRLRGVLARPIACVENGDRCGGGGLISRAFHRMAQNEHVAVTFEALDRIGKRLALLCTARARVNLGTHAQAN